MKTWSCKIGEVDEDKLPSGSDAPMREAVARAYKEITGEDAEFIFSGWGAELTEPERAVVENREPNTEPEILEVRRDDSGILRWWTATRDGWELVGVKDGQEIMMRANTYAEGTRFELTEPSEG